MLDFNIEGKYGNLVKVLRKTEEGNKFLADLEDQTNEVKQLKQDKIDMQFQMDELTLNLGDVVLKGGAI